VEVTGIAVHTAHASVDNGSDRSQFVTHQVFRVSLKQFCCSQETTVTAHTVVQHQRDEQKQCSSLSAPHGHTEAHTHKHRQTE